MSEHEKCHYSIKCYTKDKSILFCLRALCQESNKSLRYPQIGWGGTNEKDWIKTNELTLRFTSDAERLHFISNANRLFKNIWSQISTDDNDPAKPRR